MLTRAACSGNARVHDRAMLAIAQTSQRKWPKVGAMAAIGA